MLAPAVAVLLAVTPAAAQNPGGLPGGRGVDTDVQRAQFTGVMLGVVRAQIGEWMDLWQAASPELLARHYTSTATLVPPGGRPVQGPEELAGFAAVSMATISDAGLTITDFDASEGIAYMYGAYSFTPRRAGELLATGHHVTLLQREGRAWRMRAQLYRPDGNRTPFPTNGSGAAASALAAAAPGATPMQHDAMLTLASLRTAWSNGDVKAAASLFAPDALLHLPSSADAARGEMLVAELAEAIGSSRALHTALIDFGQAERLSFLIGRYYLEPRDGRAQDGSFILVLAGQAGRRRIRSLVFTPATSAATPTAAAAATGVPAASPPVQPSDTPPARPARAPLDAAAAARIDAVFADFNGDGSPGCALAVVRHGDVVLRRGYGLADIASRARITPQTSFYAASVSKQFTAFAVALLADQGRLSLDDDVRRWIPEVPDFGRTITIRHLIHHTSGLRDYLALLNLAGWATDGLLSHAEFLELVGRQRALNFEPGTQYLYSNTGYVLLSVLVERVTGRSLREFAAADIFAPLGMTSTVFRDDHRMAVNGAALAYAPLPDGGWRVLVPRFDVVGDGGLYTTVEDLARWERNFIERTVGGESVASLIHTRGRLSNGSDVDYAFGLTVSRHRGVPIVQHGGSYAGYRTFFARFPDDGLALATLCNTATANPSQLALRAAEVLLGDRLGERPTADAAPGAAARAADEPQYIVDVAKLRDYVGTYGSAELDATWRFDASDGALVLVRPFTPIQPLRAIDDDVFGFGAARVRFERDASGRVTHLVVDAGRVRGIRFDRQ
jgi:CubicO group peptidase (beta-lactamase class C family)/ketosteroid isomerase-like protein